MSHVCQVAVVGAGVVGLSTAYHLVEKFGSGVSVTVIADKFSPNTTSDKAGSIILPIDFASSTPGSGTDLRARQWTKDTFSHLRRLYSSEVAGKIDLCMLTGYDYKSEECPDPWWKEIVFGFRNVSSSSKEAQLLHLPQSCKTVWSFTTFIINCTCYLPWLMLNFTQKGGSVREKKLLSLDDLVGYDVIINCSGLGAGKLVNDEKIRPVRGQGILVKAPWIKHFVINYSEKDVLTYVLPRAHNVVLGGTAEVGNWDEIADPDTAELIMSRCVSLIPSLRGVELIGGWAGGRPVRDAVRLEEERSEAKPPVIHCYGHGGQGIVFHWGCALHVGRLMEKYVTTTTLQSHL